MLFVQFKVRGSRVWGSRPMFAAQGSGPCREKQVGTGYFLKRLRRH